MDKLKIAKGATELVLPDGTRFDATAVSCGAHRQPDNPNEGDPTPEVEGFQPTCPGCQATATNTAEHIRLAYGVEVQVA